MRVSQGLHAEVTVRRAGFSVTARLVVAPGEILALVGPNGAGKSTLLRGLAGHEAIDGVVTCNDTTWDKGRRHLPPHRRRCGWLGQDAALFAHMTVEANLGFAGSPENTDLVTTGIEPLLTRFPQSLSGGEGARVLLAQTLAADPAVILLDEPFAAVDVTGRGALREAVRRASATRPVVLATHDPVDLQVLATHVMELRGGRIVDARPAPDYLHRPRTSLAAAWSGRNVLDVSAGTVPGRVPAPPGARWVSVARADVQLTRSAPAPEPSRWAWATTVTAFDAAPGGLLAVLAEPAGWRAPAPSGLHVGDPVTAQVPLAALRQDG